MDISDVDLAWLAGLLEGEGSFCNQRSHWQDRIYIYPRVSLQMTDRDVMQRAADLMGARLYGPYVPRERGVQRPQGKKPSWTIKLSGKRAVVVMNAILPSMGERRSARIQELLDIPFGLIEHKDAA